MTLEKPRDREFLIYLLINWNSLAYLQLITVLVYGRSPPKNLEQGYLNFNKKPWEISVKDSFLQSATLLKMDFFWDFFQRFI